MKLNSDSKEIIIPIVVSVVLFMEFLDITIISTAIPSIARDFGVSPILLRSAIISYFISLAIFIPISGWCTDKFGTKKLFLFSVALFVISSFLCSVAQNVTQLTIFRFLQGVGGAFMNPVSRIIIVRLFPPQKLVRMLGIIFTVSLAGQVFGPFLGGIIANYLSWPWIFYINIPAGIIVLLVGNSYIPQEINPEIKGFDWFGFFLSATSLLALTLFIEMLNSYEIISQTTTFTIGFAGIVLFSFLVIHCLKSKKPVLDFGLLKVKTFSISFTINLACYALNSAVTFLLPLMYQECFHYTPAKSGLMVLPIACGYVIFRGPASMLIHKLGFKAILCLGTFFTALWLASFSLIAPTTSIYTTIFVEFMFGIAMVLVFAGSGALAYVNLSKDKLSMATSIDMTFRQFAGSFGIGLSASFLTIIAKYSLTDIFNSNAKVFYYTYYLLVVFALLAFINATRLHANDGAHALNR